MADKSLSHDLKPREIAVAGENTGTFWHANDEVLPWYSKRMKDEG
jgi:hypothetical protein